MSEPSTTIDFAVRTDGNPNALEDAARLIVRKAAPLALMTSPSTLNEQIDGVLVFDRLLAALGTSLGGLCLALTAIGFYGLLAYSVSRRTREFGIRMALGAARSRVLRTVLRESITLAAVGVVIGAGVSVLLPKLIASRLYGVTPSDPQSLAIAVIALVGVSFATSAIPALRAARIDPAGALRME